ncbi:MAG: hypothetical protein ACE5G2_01570, partial [Candidatus Krumholzibacteriia bacterium]
MFLVHRNARARLFVPVWTACLLLGMSGAGLANVDAGMDLWRTDPNTTFQDLSGTPIPADFFDPGSDPFDGVIGLGGVALGASTTCPNDDLSIVDTIVERLATAVLPTVPSTDTVPIEIVELSLRSTEPITVTYNGGMNPELWDVDVHLSQLPQPQGTMTITKNHPNGGFFSSDLPVLP